MENTRIDLTENGTTTLATAGKYCDRNIDVNAGKVYEAGKKAEYDAFWDAFQQNGERTSYAYAFASIGWDENTFKPKYDICVIGDATAMFRDTKFVNLKQCLESCGISLGLSRATICDRLFVYTGVLTTLPKINFSSVTSCPYLFANCSALTTIEEVVVSEKTTFTSATSFIRCYALTHMIMTGTLAKNGLNLQWSTQLDRESLLSIIDCLKDYSADTSGTVWAVTLGTENLAKLTDAEKAVATQKGWSLV